MNEKRHLTIVLTESERNMLNDSTLLVQTGLRPVREGIKQKIPQVRDSNQLS